MTAGRAVLRDLRDAEAARVLGMLDLDSLAGRARGWIAGGVSTPAAHALAAGTPRVGSPLCCWPPWPPNTTSPSMT